MSRHTLASPEASKQAASPPFSMESAEISEKPVSGNQVRVEIDTSLDAAPQISSATMKKTKILTIVGALLLLGMFTMPIWHITLEAPQYPDPIGMNIWLNKIADRNPNDIKNINLLNHYIGMKEVPEHLPEFIIFPAVVIAMVVFGLIVGFFCNYKWNLVWLVVMSLLGCAGMYDFYLWEKDYGHNLNEKAAIKFVDENDQPMVYQPPLIGTKMILNFTAHSYPSSGVIFLGAGMASIFTAFILGRRESRLE